LYDDDEGFCAQMLGIKEVDIAKEKETANKQTR
jgi:hypothetical protein